MNNGNQATVNAETFLASMDKHAKMFAAGARATCAANQDLCKTATITITYAVAAA